MTPAQADKAIALGLSAVAVGRGLIVNPDWVALARTGHDVSVQTKLDPAQGTDLEIPTKLLTAILAANGWFVLKEQPKAVEK